MSLAGMMGLSSGMPSLTGGAGGQGGASGPAAGTSNNGLSIPISNPFNFDSSGFMVNFGTQGPVTTSGQTGANGTEQTATPTENSTGSGASAATGGAMPTQYGGVGTAGINASEPSSSPILPLLLGGLGLFLVVSHKL